MNTRHSQDETSEEASINSLKTLFLLSDLAPFYTLASYVKSSLAQENSVIGSLGSPSQMNTTLGNNANCLNIIMAAKHKTPSISFANDKEFENDSRYYEQIIYESKKVPTRQNWHDFFNGLVWSQFPITKQYFNEQHVEQIQLNQSAKKRSPVRDKLTHFDECGLVLFTNCKEVNTQLEQHEWLRLFVENKCKWHSQIIPVIFGHALWEMLLNPFVGLTAKVVVIEVTDSVLAQIQSNKDSADRHAVCDNLLFAHISQRNLISAKRPWLPMPLLGIPKWSPIEQNDSFYRNDSYFMPKRK